VTPTRRDDHGLNHNAGTGNRFTDHWPIRVAYPD
jgi:hypothetical protein